MRPNPAGAGCMVSAVIALMGLAIGLAQSIQTIIEWNSRRP